MRNEVFVLYLEIYSAWQYISRYTNMGKLSRGSGFQMTRDGKILRYWSLWTWHSTRRYREASDDTIWYRRFWKISDIVPVYYLRYPSQSTFSDMVRYSIKVYCDIKVSKLQYQSTSISGTIFIQVQADRRTVGQWLGQAGPCVITPRGKSKSYVA